MLGFSWFLIICILSIIAYGILQNPEAHNQGKPPDQTSRPSLPKTKDPPSITYDEVELAYLKKKRENNLKLTIHKTTWEKSRYGSEMIADFVIRNDGDFSAKDLVIQCRMYSETDAYLGSVSATAFKRLPQKSALTIRKLSMGFVHSQANGTTCQVADFEYDLDAMTKGHKR